LVERPHEFVAVSQMPSGCATCLKSTSHAHRDNDHEGNSPENGICRKFNVEAFRQRCRRAAPLVSGQGTDGV